MQLSSRSFLWLLFTAVIACTPVKKTTSSGGDDGIIEVVFLQINDVYEITPSVSDNRGGLARIATLRKQLLAQNPNTFTVLAGDFISPSVTGTLKYEKKSIKGKQMIETLNALGLDFVVFGNHEFDYSDQADLQARLDESKFTWLGANVRFKGDTWTQPFFKKKESGTEFCPDRVILTAVDADGTRVRIGMFGVLIDTGRKPWAVYSDPFAAAKTQLDSLRKETDFSVALTHLNIQDDKKLAAQFPELPLIMGGHEHENMRHVVGNTVVTKADANAKTAYVHTLRFDKKSKKCTLKSELKTIDSGIPDEPATATVIAKWEKIKNDALTTAGFKPDEVVAVLKKPLDCREVIVRNGQCEAGSWITSAILATSKNKAEAVIFNSGSVRVDDILSGKLTELDVVRMLPFGGGLSEVEMRGSLLRKTLDASLGNKGNGGYLQLRNIARDEAAGQWKINGANLDDAKLYRIILPDFLLTGNEQNMKFLAAALNADGKTTTNPDIPTINKPDPSNKADLRNDIRLALIDWLKKSSN